MNKRAKTSGIVFLFGMHRSGTSAIAGALAGMGFDPGEPDDLLDADKNNLAGYFERASTMRSLDEALRLLGGSWSDPPTFDGARNAASREIVTDAIATVRRQGQPGHRIMKDPRFSIFSEWLQESLLPEDLVVITVRNPIAVARSLHAVHGIGVATGVALWEHYYRAIATTFRQEQVVVIDFERAIADSRYAARRFRKIVSQFGGAEPHEIQKAVAGLMPQLRTQGKDSKAFGEWLTKDQLALWKHLKKWAYGDSLSRDAGKRPSAVSYAWLESRRIQQDLALHARQADADLTLVREDVMDLKAQISDLVGQVRSVEVERDELRGRVAEQDCRAEDLVGQVRSVEVERDELRGRVAEQDCRAEDLVGQVRSVEVERDELRGRVKEFAGRVAEVEVARAKVDRVASELNEQKDVLERRIADIEAVRGGIAQQLVATEMENSAIRVRVAELEAEIGRKQLQLELIAQSESWRVGRFVTWLPRGFLGRKPIHAVESPPLENEA